METAQKSLLKTLDRAYKVDEAINPGKRVIIRFGPEGRDQDLSKVDAWLKGKAIKPNSDDVVAYAVATKDVPELVARYKLSPNITLLFFQDGVQVDCLNLDSCTDLQQHDGNIERWVGEKKNKAATGNQRYFSRYNNCYRPDLRKPMSHKVYRKIAQQATKTLQTDMNNIKINKSINQYDVERC